MTMWLQGLLKFAKDKGLDAFLGDNKMNDLFILMGLEQSTGNDKHIGVVK